MKDQVLATLKCPADHYYLPEIQLHTSAYVPFPDIFKQMASYHRDTGGTGFEIDFLPNGQSVARIDGATHEIHFGQIGKDDWDYSMPPFVVAIAALWQAQEDCTPF